MGVAKLRWYVLKITQNVSTLLTEFIYRNIKCIIYFLPFLYTERHIKLESFRTEDIKRLSNIMNKDANDDLATQRTIVFT